MGVVFFMNKICIKSISVILSVAMVLTSADFGYGSTLFKTTSHAQRHLVQNTVIENTCIVKDPYLVSIPQSLGTVVEHFKGDKDSLIIHIQDRHIDPTAQLNIAGIIDEFISKHKVSLMCLEGASDELDTSFYDKFEDNDIKHKVSKTFVDFAIFTGAEHYKITNKDKYLVAAGVEDKELYLKHLDTHKNTVVYQEGIINFLKAVNSSLNTLKDTLYTRDLKRIDNASISYSKGAIKLPEYIKTLNSYADKASIDTAKYPNLIKFIALVQREEKIDFKLAETQREAIIKRLSETLDRVELNELLRNSMDFRTNKLSQEEFYDYLFNLIDKHDFKQKEYSQLQAYRDYIKLSKDINHLKVFDEADDFEYELMIALSSTQPQKDLILYSKSAKLLQDLYSLKLTPRQLHYLEKHKDSSDIGNIKRFLVNISSRYGLHIPAIINSFNINSYIMEQSKQYYSLALERDTALIENTLQRMRRLRNDKAILVAGGFHTQGITNILKEKGISYVVICPNICQGDYDAIYNDRIAGKLPSIEQIEAALSDTLVPQLELGKTASAGGVKELFTKAVNALGKVDRFLAEHLIPERYRQSEVRLEDLDLDNAEKIGQGSFGIVFKVRHKKTGRTYAVKVYAGEHSKKWGEQSGFLAYNSFNLLRERQIPNMPVHYEFGKCNLDSNNKVIPVSQKGEGDFYYIVMDHIEGQSLYQSVRNQHKNMEDASEKTQFGLDLAIKVAKSIQAAHENGLVIKDLSEGQFMVSPNGDIYIIDHDGIVPLGYDWSKNPNNIADIVRKTLNHSVSENANVARSDNPDKIRELNILFNEQWDVYSFGFLLLFMVSPEITQLIERSSNDIYSEEKIEEHSSLLKIGIGKDKSFNENVRKLLNFILNEVPDSPDRILMHSIIQNGIPLNIYQIISKCIQENRALRYQDMQQVISDLMQAKSVSAGRQDIPKASAAGITFSSLTEEEFQEILSELDVPQQQGAWISSRLRGKVFTDIEELKYAVKLAVKGKTGSINLSIITDSRVGRWLKGLFYKATEQQLTLEERLAQDGEIPVGEIVALQTRLNKQLTIKDKSGKGFLESLKMLINYWNHNIANFISRQFADQQRGVVELISNGLDASDEKVHVSMRNGELVVANGERGIELGKIFTCLLIPTYSTKPLQDEKIGRFGVGFLSSLNYLNNKDDYMEIVSFSDGVGFRIKIAVRIEGQGKQKRKIVVIKSIEENISLTQEEQNKLFLGVASEERLNGTSICIKSSEIDEQELKAINDAITKRFSYWAGAPVILHTEDADKKALTQEIGLDKKLYREAFVKPGEKKGKRFNVIYKVDGPDSDVLSHAEKAGSGQLVITHQGVELYTAPVPGSNTAEKLVVNLPASTKIPTSRDKVIPGKDTVDSLMEAALAICKDSSMSLKDRVALLNSLYYFLDWVTITSPSLASGRSEQFQSIVQDMIEAEQDRLRQSSETLLFVPDILQAKEFFDETESVILVNPKLLKRVEVAGRQLKKFTGQLTTLRESGLDIFILPTGSDRPVLRLGNMVFVKEASGADSSDVIWQHLLAATAVNLWIFMMEELGVIEDSSFESAGHFGTNIDQDFVRKQAVLNYLQSRIEQLTSEIEAAQESIKAAENLHETVKQTEQRKYDKAVRDLDIFNRLRMIVEKAKKGSGFFFIFKKQIAAASASNDNYVSQKMLNAIKEKLEGGEFRNIMEQIKNQSFDFSFDIIKISSGEKPQVQEKDIPVDGLFEARLLLRILQASDRGEARAVELQEDLENQEKDLIFTIDVISQWMEDGEDSHRQRIESLLNDPQNESDARELFEIIASYRAHYAGSDVISHRQVDSLLQFLNHRFIHQRLSESYEQELSVEEIDSAQPRGRLVSSGRIADIVASFFRLGRDLNSVDDIKSEEDGLRFRAAQGQIQQSVNYQDPEEYVFIRELLQNSRDAILAEEAVRASNIEQDRRRIGVQVRLVRHGKKIKTEVIVSDPVGMDIGILLNFLAIPNRSSKVEEFLTGFFGHGFFTALKESEEVRVCTSTGDGKLITMVLLPVLDEEERVITDINYEIYEENKSIQGTEIIWRKRGEASVIDVGLLRAKAEMFIRTMPGNIPVYLNGSLAERVNRASAYLSEFHTDSGARCAVYFDPGHPSVVIQRGLFVTHFDRHFLEDVLGIPLTSELATLLLRLADAGIVVELPEEMNLTRDRAHLIKRDFTPDIKNIVMAALVDAAIKAILAGKISLPYNFGYDFLTEIRPEGLLGVFNTMYKEYSQKGVDFKPLIDKLDKELLKAVKNWYIFADSSLQDTLQLIRTKVEGHNTAIRKAIEEFLSSQEAQDFVGAAVSGQLTESHRNALLEKLRASMSIATGDLQGEEIAANIYDKEYEMLVASGSANSAQILAFFKRLLNYSMLSYVPMVQKTIISVVQGKLGSRRSVVEGAYSSFFNISRSDTPKELIIGGQPIAEEQESTVPDIEEAVINNLTTKFLSNNALSIQDMLQALQLEVNKMEDDRARGETSHLNLKGAMRQLDRRTQTGLRAINLDKAAQHKDQLPYLYFFLQSTRIMIEAFMQSRKNAGQESDDHQAIEVMAYYDPQDTHVLARGGLRGISWQLGACLPLMHALMRYLKEPKDANFEAFLNNMLETVSHEMTHTDEAISGISIQKGTHNKAFFDRQLTLLWTAMQDAEFSQTFRQQLRTLEEEYTKLSNETLGVIDDFGRANNAAIIDEIGRILSGEDKASTMTTADASPTKPASAGRQDAFKASAAGEDSVKPKTIVSMVNEYIEAKEGKISHRQAQISDLAHKLGVDPEPGADEILQKMQDELTTIKSHIMEIMQIAGKQSLEEMTVEEFIGALKESIRREQSKKAGDDILSMSSLKESRQGRIISIVSKLLKDETDIKFSEDLILFVPVSSWIYGWLFGQPRPNMPIGIHINMLDNQGNASHMNLISERVVEPLDIARTIIHEEVHGVNSHAHSVLESAPLGVRALFRILNEANTERRTSSLLAKLAMNNTKFRLDILYRLKSQGKDLSLKEPDEKDTTALRPYLEEAVKRLGPSYLDEQEILNSIEKLADAENAVSEFINTGRFESLRSILGSSCWEHITALAVDIQSNYGLISKFGLEAMNIALNSNDINRMMEVAFALSREINTEGSYASDEDKYRIALGLLKKAKDSVDINADSAAWQFSQHKDIIKEAPYEYYTDDAKVGKPASAGKISPEETTPLYRGRTSAYITDSQHPGSSYLGNTPNQYGLVIDVSTLSERNSDFERIQQLAGFRSSGDVHQFRQAFVVKSASDKVYWKQRLSEKGLVLDGENPDAEVIEASEIKSWAENNNIPIAIITGSYIINPNHVLNSIYEFRSMGRREIKLPFMISQNEPAQGFNIDGSIYAFEELLYQALLKLKDHDNILKQITDAKSENDIIGKLVVMLPAIDSQEFLKEAENIKRAMEAVAKAA
jgi:serine/threonine protein kinase